jgi:hypothetical protein
MRGQGGGHPSKDRVRACYTIEREIVEWIDKLPDGTRSNFVNAILKEAIKKELLHSAPQES